MITTPLSVCLVAMPWQTTISPPMPLGILRQVAVRAGRERPATFQGALRWAKFLHDRSDGRVTPRDCEHVADQGSFHCIGEWIFAGVLQGGDGFGREGFGGFVKQTGLDVSMVEWMRVQAADFVEEAAIEILSSRPDVVGLTSTFMQNVPSLALARRLKEKRPDLLVVLGGANCDGPMGAALHRSYPFLDLVVRGEGEEVFPRLLDTLEQGGDLGQVPGLCWRRDGQSVANPESRRLIPPGQIPVPDYDDWFDQLRALPELQPHIDPLLPIETARGCWWGQSHHCTFCGLNGSAMQFRSKTPDRVIAEVTELVERYQVLNLMTSDNIIDSDYFTTVLPQLAALDWDLRIHYEVKSNLRTADVFALRDAGVFAIQPGVETLSTRVLKLMDKGVHATHNVRALRDGESAHLTLVWNWLVGFPGECEEDYEPVLRQLPALVHLQPPRGGAERIVLERFSPYFDRPELGFTDRRPQDPYRHVYDLPIDDITDIALLFDTAPAGVDDTVVTRLAVALERWNADYPASTLLRRYTDDGVVITDRREGWEPAEHLITDPALVAAYRQLEHGRTLPGLLHQLTEQGIVLPAGRAQQWLDQLQEAGLVFTDDGRYVALATSSAAVRPDLTPTDLEGK